MSERFTGLPFFNRELSWLEFNARVLNEGCRKSNLLLERLKFLAIVSSNFDEFFKVRVASLKRLRQLNAAASCPTGMSAGEQLQAIAERVRDMVAEQYRCLMTEVLPGLRLSGLDVVLSEHLSIEQKRHLSLAFTREIFPLLTPVMMRSGQPLPSADRAALQVAFLLRREGDKEREIAVVQIPAGLPRFWPLPGADTQYGLIEDIIIDHANHFFDGCEVVEHAVFRITRDADMGVDEERDEDFVEAMSEIIDNRDYSLPVRLELSAPDAKIRKRLMRILNLSADDVYDCPGPLDLGAFMELCGAQKMSRQRLPGWRPQQPRDLPVDADLFATLRKRDILLHHPYESFEPVIQLVKSAADDASVVAIKMTLYRTSGDSPIVDALLRAARNGKQVIVLVELKARFDERRNITWAEQLDRAGAIVIYGVANLKVHAKALLIIRRERDGMQRYVHLGTGNYNEKTAELYVDMGLMTARDDVTLEACQFFNYVTGYSEAPALRHLIMAPLVMKNRFLQLIARETERSTPDNPGLIMAKMNSLADPDIIEALYKASQAGVSIRLNIRGICMLVPGVDGVSDNIEVVSVVGRFLEHTRAFYFHNGGDVETYLASADWMPRNLERRIELMFAVTDANHQRRLTEVLETFFRDDVNAHRLTTDGGYQPIKTNIESPFACQDFFCAEARELASAATQDPTRRLTVRRKPPKVK